MNNKKTILLNALTSVFQVIVTGGSLFLLYGFLLKKIGVDRLGIWSVVVATTSLANVANLGFSGSVIKFVSKYLAREERGIASRIVQTALVSVTLIVGIVFIAAYPIIGLILKGVVPAGRLPEALMILPFTFVSLWVMLIANVVQGSLDGHQRIYIRSSIQMFGTLLYMTACFVAVPHFGLKGLAACNIGQSVFVLTASWLMLRKFMPSLPLIAYRWDKGLFKEMAGYGLNFQVITICNMFFDPVTKSLLTKFGGLHMTGYYEMANKMLIQIRGIVFNANKVLVPAIANLQERQPEIIQGMYIKSYRLLLFMAVPIFTGVVALAPVISRIWIGHYEQTFVFFVIMLAVGWFSNALLGPAFISNLGMGRLKWNTASNIIMAGMNSVLGFLFGKYLGGSAVVAGWTVSLVTGSLVVIVSYHRIHKISFAELMPKESALMLLASLGALTASGAFYRYEEKMSPAMLLMCVAFIFMAVMAMPVLRPPMRKSLFGWVSDGILNRR
ncbi:MAG TPA: oligosaccharide flippase family protein [Nitrospirota bacterium]